MLLAKTVLFLVVTLTALEAVAAAQNRSESSAGEPPERATAPEAVAARAGRDLQPTARLANGGIPAWLSDYPIGSSSPRPMAMFAPQALPAGARYVTPRTPAGRVLRVINGRFVPIPMLQWRMRAPIDPHATLAVSPSVFIGRRPTFMPEGFRGGRTFGFAVHVRVNLSPAPPAPPQSAPSGSRAALLASKVRALLATR